MSVSRAKGAVSKEVLTILEGWVVLGMAIPGLGAARGLGKKALDAVANTLEKNAKVTLARRGEEMGRKIGLSEEVAWARDGEKKGLVRRAKDYVNLNGTPEVAGAISTVESKIGKGEIKDETYKTQSKSDSDVTKVGKGLSVASDVTGSAGLLSALGVGAGSLLTHSESVAPKVAQAANMVLGGSKFVGNLATKLSPWIVAGRAANDAFGLIANKDRRDEVWNKAYNGELDPKEEALRSADFGQAPSQLFKVQALMNGTADAIGQASVDRQPQIDAQNKLTLARTDMRRNHPLEYDMNQSVSSNSRDAPVPTVQMGEPTKEQNAFAAKSLGFNDGSKSMSGIFGTNGLATVGGDYKNNTEQNYFASPFEQPKYNPYDSKPAATIGTLAEKNTPPVQQTDSVPVANPMAHPQPEPYDMQSRVDLHNETKGMISNYFNDKLSTPAVATKAVEPKADESDPEA